MTNLSTIRRTLTVVGRKSLAILSASALALQMVLVAIPPQTAEATFTVAPAAVGAAYDELSAAVGVAVPPAGPVSTTVSPNDFGSEAVLDVTGDVEHVGSSLRLKTNAVVPGLVSGAAVTPIITKPTGASWSNFQFNYNNVAAAGSSVEMQVWDASAPAAPIFSSGPQVALGTNTYVSAAPILDTIDSIVLRFVFVRAVATDASPRLTLYRINWNEAITTGPYIQQSLTVALNPINSVGDQLPAVLPAGSGQNTNLFYLWNFDTSNVLDISACSANPAHASFTHVYPFATQYTARLFVFSGDNTCSDATVMDYVDTLVSVGQYELSVDKMIDASNGPLTDVLPGETMTVSLDISNAHLLYNAVAQNVSISDVLPGSMTYEGNFSCSPLSVSALLPNSLGTPAIGSNGTVTIGFAQMQWGDTATCTFDVGIPDPTLDQTTFLNTASISATGWNDGVAPLDADQSNNTDADVSVTVNIPTLEVTKNITHLNGVPVVGPIAQADPGDLIRYSVTVYNVGSGDASNVVATDTFPTRLGLPVVNYSGVTSNPCTAAVTPSASDVMFTFGAIGAMSSCTVDFELIANSSVDELVFYTNSVGASGEWSDTTSIPADGNTAGYFGTSPATSDDDSDDNATASFQALEPALVTSKSADTSACSYAPLCAFGDIVTYTATVTNVGNGVAYNVHFVDAPATCTTSLITGTSTVTYPDSTTDTTDGNNIPCFLPTGDGSISWFASAGATLLPGETVTLTWSVIISDPGIINGATYTDTVGVDQTFGFVAVDGLGNAIPTNNSVDVPADTDSDDMSSASFTVVAPVINATKAIVDVDGAGSSKTPEVGSIITYEVTYQNVGGAGAYDLYFYDDFDGGSGKVTQDPADVGLCGAGNVSADFSGVYVATDTCSSTPVSYVSWTGLGVDLDPTETVTLTYSAKVGLPPATTGFFAASDSFSNAAQTNYCLDKGCTASLNEGVSLVSPYVGPMLDIIKTPSNLDVEASGIASFDIVLLNYGLSDAYNVVLSDVLPSELSYVSGSMTIDYGCDGVDGSIADPSPNFTIGSISSVFSAGATCLNYDTTVAIPMAVADLDVLSNTATVSGEYIDGSAITETLIFGMSMGANVVVHVPDLDTTKTADTSFCVADPICSPTETVTWDIDVFNPADGGSTPNGSAYNVEITDTIPAGFTYDAGSTTGCTTSDPSISGSVLTWTIGSILPGDTCSISFDTTIANTVDAVNNPYVNTAMAMGTYVDGVTPIVDLGSSATDTDSVDVGVFKPVITMTADQTTVDPGDIVNFTITAENQGNIAGTGVHVVYQNPSILTILGATCSTSCPFVIGSVDFNIGNLAAGQTVTMTVQTRVNANAPAGNFLSTATLTSDQGTTAFTTSASTLYDEWMLVSTGSSTLVLLGLAAGLTALVRRRKVRA